MSVKEEFKGQTVSKNGVSVVVSDENIPVLIRLGLSKYVDPPKAAKKMTMPDKKKFSEMNVSELKERAKIKGIEGYSTMNKAELIENVKDN